jgi:hypothetical protein
MPGCLDEAVSEGTATVGTALRIIRQGGGISYVREQDKDESQAFYENGRPGGWGGSPLG